MFKKIASTFNEYPRFLLIPFFALYITERFNVGMTEVSFLFSINSAGNIIGGLIGGALVDKYGRKKLILFGLTVSGIYYLFRLNFIDSFILHIKNLF